MPLSKNDVLLFQGDSITDCGRAREDKNPNANWALGSGYANLTAAALLANNPKLNLQTYNRGISGNRIVDLYARLREDTLNLKPSILSILIGVNDTWHHFSRNAGVPVPKFEGVYRQLLEEVREEIPKIQFVLCEPFVLKCGVVKAGWIKEMNDRRKVVRKLADEFNAVFVPFQDEFDKAVKHAKPEYWAADGVHPSPAGHKIMSDAWLRAFGA